MKFQSDISDAWFFAYTTTVAVVVFVDAQIRKGQQAVNKS
jgi:hypothetical protein